MSEVIGGHTMRRLHFLGWSGSELFFLASFSLFVYDRPTTATVKPLERRINQMTRVTRKATPTKRAGLESAATPLLFLGSERGGRVMGYAGSKCSTCVLLCAPDGRNGWLRKYRAHPVRYLACSKPSIVFVNIICDKLISVALLSEGQTSS